MSKSSEELLRAALEQIVWIKDCGIDGADETGVCRNWPDAERDAMYDIAKKALQETAPTGAAAAIQTAR